MKLKDLIELAFSKKEEESNNMPIFINAYSDVLDKNELELIIDKLKEVDEFKDIEIILIDNPTLYYTDDLTKKHLLIEIKGDLKIKHLLCEALLINENTEKILKGRYFIYSITLTPEIFDPNKKLSPIKDGACIGPDLYSPVDFSKKKEVMLELNVEENIELTIKNAKKLLEKVIRNENDYKARGERKVIVRGVLETENNKDFFKNIIFPKKETDFVVNYLVRERANGFDENNMPQYQMKLKKVIISNKFKERFEEEFPLENRHLLLNEENINNFLEKYKIKKNK
jgi:hypothetical protein